ncbi:MAG: SUMF1/EgtB/PvdO family nonheme iron enzyme [Saprospiraceae bacterium]
MKIIPAILLLLAALLAPALASAQCCCCIKRDAGQKLYDQGKYEAAIAKWQEGKTECGDAPDDCPDLDQRISKARAKIKERDQAAAQRRREQEAAAQQQREREEREAATQQAELQRLRNKADDDLWDVLKDGNAADCDRYLSKYPESKPGRHTQEALKRKKTLTGAGTSTTPSSGLPLSADKMAFIAGGTYQMGDVMGDKLQSDETVHTVTISPFYLSKTEVTFDEYDAFCTATGREKPSDSGWGRGRRPVINVDWYDAVEYCNWLSARENLPAVYTIDKTRQDPNNQNTSDSKKWIVTADWSAKGYRLPTEAEWEYAAREGGKKVRFGNGRDVIDPSEINFDARTDYKKSFSIVGEYRGKTVPVDQLSANSLGPRHMSGNVWEWCWDWYDDDYYSQSEGARNPSGPGAGNYRVCRGGSWGDYPEYCRASNRSWYGAYYRYYVLGFRVARGY